MLYVSSRDRNDTYTAHVALINDYAKDGGCLLPFQIPVFSAEELGQLKEKSFNQIVSEILNIFFSARLTSWDVDFGIGKQTCRFASMNHKLLVGELWHNPDADFKRATERIAARLVSGDQNAKASVWLKRAVRIAVLFAAYGQAVAEGFIQENIFFDLVVPAEDMIWPVAVTVAKKMGLPVGTLVCSCSSESNIWDLIHKGSLSTAGLSAPIREGVEAMLSLLSTPTEVLNFLTCSEKGRSYTPTEQNPFVGGYYCTVAGKNRLAQSINSLFRSNQYIVDPECAVSISGLQDYRAGTGAGSLAVLFSEQSPLNYSRVIADATGITEQTISQYVKH